MKPTEYKTHYNKSQIWLKQIKPSKVFKKDLFYHSKAKR